MTQIAVVNMAPGLADDREIAFWVDAVNQQAKAVAKTWNVEYTPVAFYSTADGLPTSDEARLLTIQATMDVPGALGYHTDDLGVIFARVLYTGPETSITLSHEVLEEIVDPTADLWDPYDDTFEQAREACDRVEGDSYFIASTIMGETRQVPVSNWLFPWGLSGGNAPYDFMGTVKGQNGMSPGGYTILRNKTTGDVSNKFAARTGERIVTVIPGSNAAHANLALKLAKPGSRLLRRLRG